MESLIRRSILLRLIWLLHCLQATRLGLSSLQCVYLYNGNQLNTASFVLSKGDCVERFPYSRNDDDDEFRFNDASTHEGHLRQTGVLTWFCNETAIMISPILDITRTRLYNFDPLKPHFYIVKLGFTGVYINFLISVQNIDCGYSL